MTKKIYEVNVKAKNVKILSELKWTDTIIPEQVGEFFNAFIKPSRKSAKLFFETTDKEALLRWVSKNLGVNITSVVEAFQWEVMDEIEIEDEDLCAFWNPTHTRREYDTWYFLGTKTEIEYHCLHASAGNHNIDGYLEETYFDEEFDRYAKRDGTVYFEGSSFDRGDDWERRITVRRTFRVYDPNRKVRLVRFLSMQDYEMLKKTGRIVASGRTHAHNYSDFDGERVFCFLDGKERDWANEGYAQSVARIVIEVKESRVDYHSANYDYSNVATKEATIGEIRVSDIVEFHRLRPTEKIFQTLREIEEYHADNAYGVRAMRRLRKDILDRKVKGDFNRLRSQYESDARCKMEAEIKPVLEEEIARNGKNGFIFLKWEMPYRNVLSKYNKSDKNPYKIRRVIHPCKDGACWISAFPVDGENEWSRKKFKYKEELKNYKGFLQVNAWREWAKFDCLKNAKDFLIMERC